MAGGLSQDRAAASVRGCGETPTPAHQHGEAWAAALRARKPKCSGYCVGTDSIYTLVEDLACPVHGIAAQERAALVYPDREAWLNAVRQEATS